MVLTHTHTEREEEVGPAYQCVKLFCASIIHTAPPHHTVYTHPHPPCTPVTPHAHMYMYIHIAVHTCMFNNSITAMSYYEKVRQYKVKVLLLI